MDVDSLPAVSNIDANMRPTGSKFRRTFDAITHELEPYTKRPRLIESMEPIDSLLRSNMPNLKSMQHINFAWLLSHFLNISNTPMWVGFNSLLYEDTACRQNIFYLTTINALPTSKAVVKETMDQS